MDNQGFRAMLKAREVPDEKIEAAIALVDRFETFIEDADGATIMEKAWSFSEYLIQTGENTQKNYITLARYGLFTKNDALFVAILELLDGYESQENLYHRIVEVFGEDVRNEVFAEIGIAPLGLPTRDKPGTMHPVIERLEAKVGTDACAALLSDSLRDLPVEYPDEVERYKQANGDIDAYLRLKKQAFVEQLETCQREGRLFFAQEINDDVIAFVKANPEIDGGRREGNTIYVTKIPFMTPQHLAETDPVMKRYYYCHCPWSREAIKNGNAPLTATFCNCSAGFHKKPWEAIFGQPLKADVLESVLKGDNVCRFAIHLPEDT